MVMVHVCLVMMVLVFILLPTVLLVADDGFQIAPREVDGIVPHHFVVLDLLIGQRPAVALGRRPRADELAGQGVALALGDAGRQVIDGARQPRVAPRLADTKHQTACHIAELRAGHIAVVPVLIGMGHLLTEPAVPHEAFLVAGKREGIMEEAIVGLIFRGGIHQHRPLGGHGRRVENHHTGHGIGAIHQRGGTFQNLHGTDSGGIYLHAVLVAPLLTFLAHAVAHDDDAVVAQSADDGFRDGTARGELRQSGQVADGIDDIGRGGGVQLLMADHGNGGRGVLQLGVAGDAGHHDIVQFQMAEEHVGRVFLLLVVMVVLLGKAHATHARQQQ